MWLLVTVIIFFGGLGAVMYTYKYVNHPYIPLSLIDAINAAKKSPWTAILVAEVRNLHISSNVYYPLHQFVLTNLFYSCYIT